MKKMQHELILVIDFGGQYNQLIARRVRECGVYCEIVPYTYTHEQIKAKNPKGIIFTGGQTAYMLKKLQKLMPVSSSWAYRSGICYGHQFMAHTLGGHVESAGISEFGKTSVEFRMIVPC
jgi:GMP synthase (glutamine-hydrolysing)